MACERGLLGGPGVGGLAWAVALLALVQCSGGGGALRGGGTAPAGCEVHRCLRPRGLAIQLRGGGRGSDPGEGFDDPGPASLADWLEPVFKEGRKHGKRQKGEDDDALSRHGSAGDAFDSWHKKDDKGRRKDRSDRATVEQVLDPRTKNTLMRMLMNGKLLSVHGCLSTGKEANVYYGTAPVNDTEAAEAAASCGPGDAESSRSTLQLSSGLSNLELENTTTTREPLFSETSDEGSDLGVVDGGQGDVFDDRTRIFLPSGVAAESNLAENRTNTCEVAIKIFKTSILVFKDRDKYISGDYRFRHGYSKNPRKMVRMWAEKEHRNLIRLWAAGIRCPRPILCRTHILVMEFIGNDGKAAPKLRDALPEDQDWTKLFHEAVIILRALFHRCNLVHGDLSEYNILYFEGHLTVIDVSQAVQPEHPMALEFLRRDIRNIAAFFERKGCAVPSLRSFFDIVIRQGLEDAQTLELLEERGQQEDDKEGSAFTQDAVFMGSHIPTALAELEDPEFEMTRLAQGSASGQLDNYGLLRGIDMEEVRKTAVSAQAMADQAEQEALSRTGVSRAGGSRVSTGKLKASDILASLGLNAFGAPHAVNPAMGLPEKPTSADSEGHGGGTQSTSTAAAVPSALSARVSGKREAGTFSAGVNTVGASFRPRRRQDNRTFADVVKSRMNRTDQPHSALDSDEKSESTPDEDIPDPVNWGEWQGPDGGNWGSPAPRTHAAEVGADGWNAQHGRQPELLKYGWGADGGGFLDGGASDDAGLASSDSGQDGALGAASHSSDCGYFGVSQSSKLDEARMGDEPSGEDLEDQDEDLVDEKDPTARDPRDSAEGGEHSQDEQGQDSSSDADDDDDSRGDGGGSGGEGDGGNRTWVPKEEWNHQKDSRNGLSKAEWKQRVKEEKRRKRSTKLKKHLKKRAVAKSSARKA